MIMERISIQYKKLKSVIKDIDKENNVKIAFSGIVHREDRDCKNMTDDTNKKLKSYCASIGIGFINNVNIDGSCLVFWLKIWLCM